LCRLEQNATASIDAAIHELRTACRIAPVPDFGASESAARYFEVVKVRP
jgi:hypothetical protein